MSANNHDNGQNGKPLTRWEEMKRFIAAKDWDGFDKLLGFSREEDERILREEHMIDAAEVNRQMEELDRIDDERAARAGDGHK